MCFDFPALTADMGSQESDLHHSTAGSHWVGAVSAVRWEGHHYRVKWFHYQVQCMVMCEGVMGCNSWGRGCYMWGSGGMLGAGGGVTVDKWSCGRWEDGHVMVEGGRWVTFGGWWVSTGTLFNVVQGTRSSLLLCKKEMCPSGFS